VGEKVRRFWEQTERAGRDETLFHVGTKLKVNREEEKTRKKMIKFQSFFRKDRTVSISGNAQQSLKMGGLIRGETMQKSTQKKREGSHLRAHQHGGEERNSVVVGPRVWSGYVPQARMKGFREEKKTLKA